MTIIQANDHVQIGLVPEKQLLGRRQIYSTLQWIHNGRDSVSGHQTHDCLLNRSFRRRSKKTSKLRVTALCAWNSPKTGEFAAQMASNEENVSIWWRHHEAVAKLAGLWHITQKR